jgi:hypothetical protein
VRGALVPPPEHEHLRWHWIDTPHGVMCASWYPSEYYGSWDVSGYTEIACSAKVLREWRYLGPAIPPTETT